MRRIWTVLAVAGILAGAASSVRAQEGPEERPGRGPGWGRGQREAPPPDQRERMRERWEQLSPEEREKIRERREQMAKRRQGAEPDDGRRGERAEKPGLPQRVRQWLAKMPEERRRQVLQRLRNASPEDRQRFLRRFAERDGAEKPRAERRGAPDRARGRRQGADRRPERFGRQGVRDGERCPHCGRPLPGAGARGQDRRGPRGDGDLEMRRRAFLRQMFQRRMGESGRGRAPWAERPGMNRFRGPPSGPRMGPRGDHPQHRGRGRDEDARREPMGPGPWWLRDR